MVQLVGGMGKQFSKICETAFLIQTVAGGKLNRGVRLIIGSNFFFKRRKKLLHFFFGSIFCDQHKFVSVISANKPIGPSCFFQYFRKILQSIVSGCASQGGIDHAQIGNGKHAAAKRGKNRGRNMVSKEPVKTVSVGNAGQRIQIDSLFSSRDLAERERSSVRSQRRKSRKLTMDTHTAAQR